MTNPTARFPWASLTDPTTDRASWSERARSAIEQHNARLGAFLAVAKPEPVVGKGPLAGVPLAVKDNIAVRDLPLTCGSRILEGYLPPYQATVVDRLVNAGAHIAGKTNMDEFAMGSTTEFSAYGPCRNPWDETRTPGGSSGGSAAAVAAGLVPVALGSDTGGSVRQPAAMCGIVGFKPSYGTVSRFGLVLYGSSLDQIGVLSHRVSDARIVFDCLRGPDGRDETLVPADRLETAPLSHLGRPVRVGLVREYLERGAVSPAIRRAVERTAEACREAGFTVAEVSLPELDETVVPAYYLTACAEASSNLQRYDGIRFGSRRKDMPDDADLFVRDTRSLFGPEVKQRILLGTFILRTGHYDRYYSRAQAARRALCRRLAAAFTEFDLLLTPVFPTQAPKLGELLADPLAMKLADLFTVTANLTGLPAISLPVDVADGLPTAAQLMAGRFHDLALLEAAERVQEILAFDPSACPGLAEVRS